MLALLSAEPLDIDVSMDVSVDSDEISEDVVVDAPSNPDPSVEPEQYPDSNNDRYYSTMDDLSGYADMDAIDSKTISAVYPVEKEFPRCPVYIRKNADGGLVVTAYITGPIEENAQYITLLEMLEYASEHDTLYLFIDSPGGMVSTGAVIASAIDSCKGKVVGVARGFCASAASLIWSACDVCIASPMSVFLYHMSLHFDFGNSQAIRERADILIAYVKEVLLKIALDKGHITQDEFVTIVKGKDDVIIPAPVMVQRLGGVK